jgi:hypothetical protein
VPAGATYDIAVNAFDAGSTCPTYNLRLGSAAPYPIVVPSLTGPATEGQTATLADGTWSGTPGLARQWQRCDSLGLHCEDLAGATGSTFTLTGAEIGKRVRARVTATEGAGSASAVSPPSDIVTAAPPPPFAGIPLAPVAVFVGSTGVVNLSFTCPAATIGNCAGADTLRSAGKVRLRPRRPARILALGSQPVLIAAGKAGTVRFKLSKPIRALLARRGRLRAVQIVRTQDARNLPVRTTGPVTLLKRRRGK